MKATQLFLAFCICSCVFGEFQADYLSRSKLGRVAPHVSTLDWIQAPIELKKWVLVEFWASWCAPCIQQIPRLNEISGLAPESLVVLGISGEEVANIENAITKKRIQYSIAHDVKSVWRRNFWCIGVPQTLLLNPAGKCVWEGDLNDLSDELLIAVISTPQNLNEVGYRYIKNGSDMLLLPTVSDTRLNDSYWHYDSHQSLNFNNTQGWLTLAGFDETFLERALENTPPYRSAFHFSDKELHLLEDSKGLEGTSRKYYVTESTPEYVTILFKGSDTEVGEDCYQYNTIFFNSSFVTAQHHWDKPIKNHRNPSIRALWNKTEQIGR